MVTQTYLHSKFTSNGFQELRMLKKEVSEKVACFQKMMTPFKRGANDTVNVLVDASEFLTNSKFIQF